MCLEILVGMEDLVSKPALIISYAWCFLRSTSYIFFQNHRDMDRYGQL